METVVYVAILGMISVFIVNSFVQIAGVYSRARSEREALANARAVLETLASTSASARTIYAPASRFNVNAGQLSLYSPAMSTPGHKASYVDFWIDNGRAFVRGEGESAIPISASSVRISLFRFERIAQALGRDAIKITVRADSVSAKYPASVTLNTTVALRGNY